MFRPVDAPSRETSRTVTNFRRHATRVTSGLFSALALAGAVSLAQPALAQSASGNADAGRTKALTCMGCHGNAGMRNAYPSFHIPKIGGQHPEYIVAALQAYKNGERSHETMRAQAASLSDQDMADIAAWLKSLADPK